MKDRILTFLTLFTSLSTPFCCALPALFVTLGMGAAFAGLVTKFPQLVWVSENKTAVFGTGALLLLFGGIAQLKARNAECPTDPKLAQACKVTRGWSLKLYVVSVGIYLVGTFFAFGQVMRY